MAAGKEEQKDRQPTRTAGIYKRPRRRGEVYEARYRAKDGKQAGKTFPALEAAEGFLVEQKHWVRAGEYIDKSKANTPWSLVAEQWMNSTRLKGRKARTLKGYQHTLDSWCSDWDDWTIGSIGFEGVQALIVRMMDEGKLRRPCAMSSTSCGASWGTRSRLATRGRTPRCY